LPGVAIPIAEAFSPERQRYVAVKG